MIINFFPISKGINLKDFDCGDKDLNIYLSRFALPNDKKNISKTFVAINPEDPTKPLGYYSVSMAQVIFETLPQELQKGLPKYPVPAMRIGRLARDLSFKTKGLGPLLLKNAFERAISISSEVALNCVLVDASNEKAKSFYLKFGFIPFNDEPLTLVLPLKTIIQSI
ncbi:MULTISPECIES: GNAT family N-acetyltransferase [unclassified Oceanispirochaeta]|uniref:GNAT family N-acetyltransferase n=1 Tax=unclassified Oceanispirochaeta TaxID=2635722 RepID=UPI000E08CE48|nr:MULTISPECIES: GNAT family N-acetyltransferase [unclassified Oceanispirochaeta]MBF9018719.1 GNAT family N-acetyltransferase [Oceanispirochaeta sp. M2]NPD75171.1 GNAT family N-acetyltransferase [Oceanispirochaeta sp. M1]RDG28992.1 GNAT family N-acetyltransferase [Oceanispirochaeta sp. M1]